MPYYQVYGPHFLSRGYAGLTFIQLISSVLSLWNRLKNALQ